MLISLEKLEKDCRNLEGLILEVQAENLIYENIGYLLSFKQFKFWQNLESLHLISTYSSIWIRILNGI